MSKQRHVIGRTVLELHTGQLADVWSLQEEVSRLFRQQGVPAMEHLFDRLVGDEEVIRFDRVEVDLGFVDRQFLADEFIQKLTDVLSQILEDRLADRLVAAIKTNNITRNDRVASDWEVLLYFLRYGRLPWWCPSGDWQAWFLRCSSVTETDDIWRQNLRELLVSDRRVRQRLVEQLPEHFRYQLILHLQPAWAIWHNLLTEARQLMQSLKLASGKVRYLERQAWLLLLAEINTDDSPTRSFPETWISNWLTQLVQIWRQSAGLKLSGIEEDSQKQTLVSLTEKSPSVSEESNKPDFNQIALQRLHAILAAIPNDEQALWLTALDQISTAPLLNLVGTSTPQEQREEQLQGSEFFPKDIQFGVDIKNITPSPKGENSTPQKQREEQQQDSEFVPKDIQFGVDTENITPSPKGENSTLQKQREEQLQGSEFVPKDIQSGVDTKNITPSPKGENSTPQEQREEKQQDSEFVPNDIQSGVDTENITPSPKGETSTPQEQREEQQQDSEFVPNDIQSGVDTKNITPSSKTNWEVLLHFLRYGRLPCREGSEDLQYWLTRWSEVMQSDTAWRQSLSELLTSNPEVRQRLFEQLPEAFRHQLILQLQPGWIIWHTMLVQARQLMESLSLSKSNRQKLEKQAWLLLLAEISTDNAPTRPFPETWISNWLAQLLQTWLQSAAFQESVTADESQQKSSTKLTKTSSPVQTVESKQGKLSNPQENTNQNERQRLHNIIAALPIAGSSLWLNALDQVLTTTSAEIIIPREFAAPFQASNSTLSKEEETAGLYVTQAGLVLLHPFLRFYFEAVELYSGESFQDESTQQMAIYLLYYLATKQTDVSEYELVLPKLLCGWPLNEPVVRVDLPDAALREGENLLQTAIDYWDALKSTSPDGLRQGFLQREGKLTRSGENNWKLQVEQQAIDILLSRLPWGLSMVRLPWMEELLIVEWN